MRRPTALRCSIHTFGRGDCRATLESLESRRLCDTTTFTSPDPIAIPADGTGEITGSPGSPYPATIDVSGMTGSISKVTVTLNGLTHTFPQDLDLLLVGPTGRSVLLMSDVGTDPISGESITFDDEAEQFIAPFGTIASGSYRPTNYNQDDVFPTDAPPEPWSGLLSTFAGTIANGTWKLYVVDDAPGDVGQLTEGWSLSITSDEVAPRVLDAKFLYNFPPQKIQFAFTKSVAGTIDVSDLTVVNLDTNETLPASQFDIAYDERTNTGIISNMPTDYIYADANYRITVTGDGLFEKE